MAEVNENKRALIGAALAELVATARSGGPRNRVGLMAAGSELPVEEFLLGAATAMRRACPARGSMSSPCGLRI